MSAFEPASDGPSCVARQADRRSGWADLMASLAHAIAERADISTLRGIFEQRLHRMVSVRSLRLKDARNRWAGPSECQETAESVAFEVPGVSGGGVLEAAIDCGSSMGDWDYQTLAAAAHAASLILEIDRGRQQLARVGLTPATRSAQEPAVSLIGRTPALKALRAQVERVAGTDFTVLVEGESGAELEFHLRCGFASQCDDGSVERAGKSADLTANPCR
jgi:DNA-binding NtrC family response regulator